MIGERMTMEEIMEKYPYMYVVLSNWEVNEHNAICAGVLEKVLTIDEANKVDSEYVGKDCPYILLPTFSSLPFPMCMEYDIVL